jgi:hypothetical protein
LVLLFVTFPSFYILIFCFQKPEGGGMPGLTPPVEAHDLVDICTGSQGRYEWDMKGLGTGIKAELQIYPWVLAGERGKPGIFAPPPLDF